MTTAAAQSALDTTGYYKFPAFDELDPLVGQTYRQYVPTLPLFVDTGCTVEGGGPRTLVNAYESGVILVTGWPRGLVSDAHFAADGFRTMGDVCLFARGTEWDMGPRQTSGDQGWSTVTRLDVRIDATRHFADWSDTPLCGMQGRGTYGPHPRPWQVYVGNGYVQFSLYTEAGVEYHLQGLVDTTTLPARTVFVCTYHQQTGLVDIVVNGVTLTVTGTPPPAGHALHDNGVAAFHLGRIDPGFMDSGFWNTNTKDITFHQVDIGNAGVDLCQMHVSSGASRPTTYPGGPSLPLLSVWTAGGGKYLWTVRTDQGVGDANSDVTLKNLWLLGKPAEPAVVVGATFGPLVIESSKFSGGSRAVMSTGHPVEYPVRFRDVIVDTQFDCGLWLYRAIGSVRDVTALYPRRCAVELSGCSMHVCDMFVAPGGSEPTESAITQHGGEVSYEHVHADYEGQPADGYGLVRFDADSFDSAIFESNAFLSNCSSGSAPKLSFPNLTPPETYLGAVNVIDDGIPVYVLPARVG